MNESSLKDIINSKEARRYLNKIGNVEILEELDEAKRNKNNLDIVIQNIPFAISLKDINGSIIEVNDNFLKYYNAKKEDIIGQNWRKILKKDYVDKIIQEDKKVISRLSNITFRRRRIINGELRLIEVYKMPVLDNKNNPIGIVGIYSDITNFKRYSDKIKQLVFTDSLTGLDNRRSLYKYLERIKKEQRKVSLIAIDVDDFKKVNDMFGHYWGDKVLALMANIFKEVCNDAFISRISGDEFIIIYKDITDERLLIEKVTKIINTLRLKFKDKEKISIISASFGILIDDTKNKKIEDLLVKADLALYKAKIRGKNQYAFYTDEIEKERLFKLKIERGLRKAIENNEVELYYQPQYTCDKELIGFEALFRWNNEKFKDVPVSKIIDYIEESNMVHIFGECILRKALLFSKKINANRKKRIVVSVNISAIQIMYEKFTDTIKNLLKEIDIEPTLIGLELTETTLLENVNSNIKKIKELKEFGVKIYLDDFGKGYSSLNYLVKLPISTVKIDREFIKKMNDGKEYEKLVKLMIDICHSLDLPVVAEGVETEKELDILRNMNVEFIQGYLFSKPLCEEEARKLINL
ncbi:EAL domain-containing protein [Clostridium sp. Ade.TY]|uniref:sensor domain-containing protein n=1 Tax=Clostridium sp. Ade.TY TaxID=1391647 RepID=UPI000415136B|nr:EAL domain-containing protein [Clostridium sp. Ade.TY]